MIIYDPDSLAARLTAAVKRAGISILGVSIDQSDKPASWRISQDATTSDAAKQAAILIVTSYDPTLPDLLFDAEQQDAAVKFALDTQRLMSAIVWTIIDTYSAPATVTKYQAARTKIVAAYKAQPWKP